MARMAGGVVGAGEVTLEVTGTCRPREDLGRASAGSSPEGASPRGTWEFVLPSPLRVPFKSEDSCGGTGVTVLGLPSLELSCLVAT